jgi:iron complex transport system substrate-binding protein
VLAVLIACGDPEPEQPAAAAKAAPSPTAVPATPTVRPEPQLFPYSVTDSNGNAVVFERPPERIVAIDSAVVEILFAIGEGHRVVATHRFVSYPPETESIPRVSDASNIDIEATVALEPDLVVVFSEGLVADLERAGLKVLYLKSVSDDFRRVADNIRMWGRITGSPDPAQQAAARFEARIRDIERILEGRGSGPTVFQDQGSLWTPGPDTLMGRVFELLKLDNIAHDVSGYAQLSPEVIVERNPEIVIASFSDEITANPAFSGLSAVENGRVLVLSSDALNVAGPRFVDGIEEIARWVYPDLFN